MQMVFGGVREGFAPLPLRIRSTQTIDQQIPPTVINEVISFVVLLYFLGVKFLYTFSILYPMPICVWIYWGESGSDSSFLRSVAIKTRSEATSLFQELPQTSWVI